MHLEGRKGSNRDLISFTLEGVKPVPQGSMRHIGNGRMIHNRAEDLAVYRAALALVAKSKFKTPTDQPVSIKIQFGLIPPKTVKRPMPIVPPDLDKLVRAVLDGLTGVVYMDDAQVVALTATKAYSQSYWVRVEVEYGAFEVL